MIILRAASLADPFENDLAGRPVRVLVNEQRIPFRERVI